MIQSRQDGVQRVRTEAGVVETTLPTAPRFSGRVGLLAGGGRFPVYFADAARKQGIEVVCVAIAGHADPQLQHSVDRFHWNGFAKLGRMIRLFKREGVECVVMAGKIYKTAIYAPWRLFRYIPDWRLIRAFWLRRRGDNRDDSLLLMVINEMHRDGLRLASALEICPELLVKAGCMTRRRPSSRELADVQFGWRMAKEMGRLDVGQSVAVKERAVLAVEAIEGTDQMILRAGALCPAGGFTVVKVAKPQQDMRFDVPTIGETTIRNIHQAGGKVLAVEADRTILIDADATIALADQLGL